MVDKTLDIQTQLKQASDDRERVDILNQKSWELRNYNPIQARNLAQMAHKLAAPLEYVMGMAESLKNLGVSKCLLGEFQSALSDAQKAIGYYKQVDFEKGQVSVFNLLGVIYARLNKYSVALKYQHKVLAYYEKQGDKRIIASTLTNIGSVYKELTQYDTALEYHLRALRMCEEIGDDRTLATTLNNVSAIYFAMDNYETALKYLLRSYPIFKRINDLRGLAHTYGNMGLIYFFLNKTEEALKYLTLSLEIRTSTGDKTGIAFSLKHLGNVYFQLKDTDRCVQYLLKSMKIYSELPDVNGLTDVYVNLGKVYLSEGRYEDANSACLSGLDVVRQSNNKDLMFRLYEVLYRIHVATGDYKKGLEYYRMYSETRNEVRNIEKHKAITAIEFRYDMERIEREKEIYRLKNVELANALKQIEQANAELEEKSASLEEAKLELEARQHQIMRFNHELEEANLRLKVSNERLLVVDKEKNEILSIVAHDLKNPLTGVLLASDSMRQYLNILNKRDILQYLDNIQSCSDSMMDLISNLLDVRMLEDGVMRFEMNKVSIARVVDKIVNVYQQRARRKGIALIYESVDDPAFVIGDEERIREVVENLVSNAIKYSPKSRRVWITVARSEEDVSVVVKDEGPGLSAEEQKKLYQKFVRLSARPTGGESSSGLGLAIARNFVERMNGRIWCDSEAGKGAAFGVSLPAHKAADAEPVATSNQKETAG